MARALGLFGELVREDMGCGFGRICEGCAYGDGGEEGVKSVERYCVY